MPKGARSLTRFFTHIGNDDVERWLERLPEKDGIRFLSQNRAYQHAEDAYDAQYRADPDKIEETIGRFVVNALPRTPKTVLELARGTGFLTASLLHDGRVKTLVASDASTRFLEITRRKTARLKNSDRLKLLCLRDADFKRIPAGTFDAIMIRSALHHFVDFNRITATLIGKLAPGGVLCMLEPRADFQIVTSIILKNTKLNSDLKQLRWSDAHEKAVNEFVAMTNFYTDRVGDKSAAEDKYSFHLEEFIGIADRTGTTLKCIGGEYIGTYTDSFRDFLRYCMSFDQSIVADFMHASAEELKFVDHAYASRPRYAAAEWFVFQRP